MTTKKLISNPESVISNLKSLLFSTRLSDFTIIISECKERIPAHRQILASSSPYFESLLYGPFVEGTSKELFVTDIDSDSLKTLLKFIYTGEAELTIENIIKVTQVANRFCVTEALIEFGKAAQQMIESFDLSEDSLIMLTSILCDSHYSKIDTITEACLEFIDVNTTVYIESDSFLQLPLEIVELIIARDTLFDGLREVSLYLGCLRWARGEGCLDPKVSDNFELANIPSDKFESLRQLMQFIRIPLIEAKYIINGIDKTGLFDKEQLYIAMAYQACPDSYMYDSRKIFKDRMGSKKPWHWSDERIGPHILLSNDKSLAIAHHYDWEKVIGNTIWYAGSHNFKVQLDLNTSVSSNSWQIIAGVACPSTSLCQHLGAGDKEWGLACYSGQKISCTDKREEYTESSKKGDIIEVKVDLTLKRLEFFKNGRSLGIAFTNVIAPVCPAVSLLKGQRVKLIWD